MRQVTQHYNTLAEKAPITGRTGALLGSGLAAAGSLNVLLGPFGLLVALCGLLTGWRGNGPLGILVLHAGVLLGAGASPLWAIGLLETAALLLIVAEFQPLREWHAFVGIIGLSAVSGGGALLLVPEYGIVVVTVGIAGIAGVLLYLGHRYEQLTLGLLQPTNES